MHVIRKVQAQNIWLVSRAIFLSNNYIVYSSSFMLRDKVIKLQGFAFSLRDLFIHASIDKTRLITCHVSNPTWMQFLTSLSVTSFFIKTMILYTRKIIEDSSISLNFKCLHPQMVQNFLLIRFLGNPLGKWVFFL